MIGVDGAVGATGLSLSHWPENRTPAALRHDLSTGSALAFARLPRAEREELAAGATAIVNNHYDTDGTCALFATRRPEAALPLAERLLAAARAGDFFQTPDQESVALDALVHGLVDPAASPLAADFAGLANDARSELVTRFLIAELPALLAADRLPFPELWEPTVAALEHDLADLGTAARRDDAARDLTVWTAPRDARSRRAGAAAFDPGRHALFGSTRADRVLVAGPSGAGTTWRLVVSTLSWFDLVTERRLPRPDLQALATRLNALEGCHAEDDAAWRAQAADNASPELWFGMPAQPSFAEHSSALLPSALAPRTVTEAVESALST